jgi:hypothetical protein
MAEGGSCVSGDGNEDGKLWINPKWKMDLLTKHHARFCLKLLHSLPVDCEELETQR